jgi:hypothetical protein
MHRSTHVLLVIVSLGLGAAALTARAQDPAPEPTPVPTPATTPATKAPKQESRLSGLWWMAGTWQGDLFGATFEEHWMRPRAGIMLGSGRLMREGKTVFTEFLRIEQKGAHVYYTVWPAEKAPTTYEMTMLNYDPVKQLGHAIFSNPEHPSQHTIEYLWNGEGVAGRIAGVRDGQDWETRFKFDRSPDGRAAAEPTTSPTATKDG